MLDSLMIVDQNMWPNLGKRFQITHFYFTVFITVTCMKSITFSPLFHTIRWNLMLKLSKLCNKCSVNTYIHINRNTIKVMLKYNRFYVWFGTIFWDSVTYGLRIKQRSKGSFSQDTSRCIPHFRDISDMHFSFDPPTQSDT